MKRIVKFLIPVFIFLILVVPVFSVSAYRLGEPIIPCGTDRNRIPCDFNGFMSLINNLISFIFQGMVVPIAAIMFFYAGFKLVTSGGNTEARGVAKNVATNAVLGLAVAAGAWLIIRTILSILGYEGGWIGF